MATDGNESDVTLDLVQVGDLLRVRPGESVPVDGAVQEGRSTLDIHGDRRVDAVIKQAGDAVIGGTVNQTGSLVMRAEKVGRDTMLARIVQMVADAQRSRAPNSAARRPRLRRLRARGHRGGRWSRSSSGPPWGPNRDSRTPLSWP